MDRSEKLAKTYLDSLKLGSVVYEPEGYKKPPDFLVGERIAVEVRRLNENRITGTGKIQGLENEQIAVLRLVRQLINESGPPTKGRSWFVFYKFKRPLLPSAQLERAIREYFLKFRDGEIETNKFAIESGFELKLRSASEPHPTCFVLATASDGDRGGFSIDVLERNIRICVAEKEKKISRVRAKYAEWWLILVDHIGYGMLEPPQIRHSLDKLILIDPQDALHVHELK
jgi:hypothetical protein